MRFSYASDQSLLVWLEESEVVRALRALEARPVEGVLNLHPAYDSVLVRFDAVRFEHAQIEAAVRERLQRLDEITLPEPRTVRIPVRYGGEYGPDLQAVAALHGLAPADVVKLHSGARYTVRFLGFAPGFGYLSGLPPELATPRLATPRRQVEAGSVAIGGAQAGVYPFRMPGGWRIIGRTPLRMFDPERDPMSLLAIGDRVEFEPL